MSIVEGFKKVKRYILTTKGYQLISQWTSSDTVETTNGKTLTEVLENKADLDVNGQVKISQIPHAALDKLVKVENDTARFSLTNQDVQTGDTVKVLESNDGTGERMYLVIDDSKLSTEDGYTAYSATTTWTTIEGRPDNLLYGNDEEKIINIETPITLNRKDIANNLITSDNTKVLGASQGVVINSKYNDIQTILGGITEYDEDSTYNIGDYCLYTNNLYKCTTAITIPIAWDGSNHWTSTTFKNEINTLNSKLCKLVINNIEIIEQIASNNPYNTWTTHTITLEGITNVKFATITTSLNNSDNYHEVRIVSYSGNTINYQVKGGWSGGSASVTVKCLAIE